MTAFICKQCAYRFESKSPEMKRKCPYCGKDGSIRREPSAEELLVEDE